MTIAIYTKPTLVDILQVCRRMPSDEREQYEAFLGVKYDYQEAALGFASKSGPSWVICSDEVPIVVAGFDYLRKGVWQDWMVSTPPAWGPNAWRGVTRLVRTGLDKMIENGAHRLQCVSLRSRIQAHRWYQVLGLRQEGVLEAYGVDGQDALMFARVRVENCGL